MGIDYFNHTYKIHALLKLCNKILMNLRNLRNLSKDLFQSRKYLIKLDLQHNNLGLVGTKGRWIVPLKAWVGE